MDINTSPLQDLVRRPREASRRNGHPSPIAPIGRRGVSVPPHNCGSIGCPDSEHQLARLHQLLRQRRDHLFNGAIVAGRPEMSSWSCGAAVPHHPPRRLHDAAYAARADGYSHCLHRAESNGKGWMIASLGSSSIPVRRHVLHQH